MLFDLTEEPIVDIPVETLREGDEIFVHSTIGFCLVSVVEQYDERFVVVYLREHLENYGNRRAERRITEKQLVPKARGEIVQARRGAPVLAELARAKMHEQEQHRWATLLTKSGAG